MANELAQFFTVSIRAAGLVRPEDVKRLEDTVRDAGNNLITAFDFVDVEVNANTNAHPWGTLVTIPDGTGDSSDPRPMGDLGQNL